MSESRYTPHRSFAFTARSSGKISQIGPYLQALTSVQVSEDKRGFRLRRKKYLRENFVPEGFWTGDWPVYHIRFVLSGMGLFFYSTACVLFGLSILLVGLLMLRAMWMNRDLFWPLLMLPLPSVVVVAVAHAQVYFESADMLAAIKRELAESAQIELQIKREDLP
ncbi:hypothetical protein Lepil_2427 [Leptonema illini DSM 21528]|uniref:Uncharacterized protein n=2 Tax=Leptonema illini TaxID=183 RepID=H2CJE5_9LEPT|nr:hypothetical protein Lepil_2427 [Leptonema illini DSM 21528]